MPAWDVATQFVHESDMGLAKHRKNRPNGAIACCFAKEADSQSRLNRLDVVQRNGWFQLPGFRYPHIAGMDVAQIAGSNRDQADWEVRSRELAGAR